MSGPNGSATFEVLELAARVLALERADTGLRNETTELLAMVRDLHESRRTDRDVLAEMSVKLDRLLLLVPVLARRRPKRGK